MRPINADALIEEIMGMPTDAHYPAWYAKVVEEAPTLDVQPVRWGEWLEVNPMFKGVYQCSACGTYIGMSTRALTEKRKDYYCSECGADMKPVRDHENNSWRA